MTRLLVTFAILATIAGCASVEKMEAGQHSVGERLQLQLKGAWNHVNAPGIGPAQVWTMEGLPVDQLLIYSGIKDGEAVHADRSAGDGERKVFKFRATMQPDEIATMFEGMLTRDGSRFQLLKLQPTAFAGNKGFRFDYALTRKADNVQLSGMAYGAVSNGELFAMLYMAPRLAFFSRHAADVEEIAKSASVRQ